MNNSKQALILILAAVLPGIIGCASTSSNGVPSAGQAAAIDAAIANPNRTDADRERDARDQPAVTLDQPAVTLALLDLERGDAALDLFGGGGYYSELLAGVVGPPINKGSDPRGV